MTSSSEEKQKRQPWGSYLEAQVEAGMHGALVVAAVLVHVISEVVHAQILRHLPGSLHQPLGKVTGCLLQNTHTHTHMMARKGQHAITENLDQLSCQA